MQFVFDQARAIQAAALLLRLNSGQMKYIKLMKLMYMADRRSLLRRGSPLTGARCVAMHKGPVLSEVLDLIRKPKQRDAWPKYIATQDNYVALINDPGDDELCDADIELLKELDGQFKEYDEWRTVDITHEMPEWRDPGEGHQRPIDPEDILRVEGRPESEIKRLVRDAAYFGAVRRALGG